MARRLSVQRNRSHVDHVCSVRIQGESSKRPGILLFTGFLFFSPFPRRAADKSSGLRRRGYVIRGAYGLRCLPLCTICFRQVFQTLCQLHAAIPVSSFSSHQHRCCGTLSTFVFSARVLWTGWTSGIPSGAAASDLPGMSLTILEQRCCTTGTPTCCRRRTDCELLCHICHVCRICHTVQP